MTTFVKFLVIFSFFLVAVFAVDFDSDSSFGSDEESKTRKLFNNSFSCGTPTESVKTVKHHLSDYENRPMHAIFNEVSFFSEEKSNLI